MSDVERTAQEATGSDPLPDYVHALMQQDQAEILSLRAALDEANTDRQRLRADLDAIMDRISDAASVARTERDRALAAIQTALSVLDKCPSWDIDVTALRAALAGEGSEQLPAKPGGHDDA